MTGSGQAVLTFSLGCSESYLDKNKQRQERTEWVRVTVWGKRAEALAKILSKGARVLVEGSLRTTSYEKNGEKRYSTGVTASNVVLCGSRSSGGSANQDDFGDSQEPDTTYPDDDIPF